MALVRPVSKLRDKNGLECDIAAEGFGGTRNVQISGDVVGNETWDGSGNVDIRVEIADNAVDNSCLTDGAVSTSKILDGAVTSEKLDTGAVTNNKLASGAVSTDKIANEAVTLAKISKDAVDTTPTASSNNLVTSGGVKAAIEAATGGGSVVNNVKYEDGKLKQTKGDTTTDVVNLDGTFAKNADVVKKTDVTNVYSATSENPISGMGVAKAITSSSGNTVKTVVYDNVSKSWVKVCSVSKVITTGNINITSNIVLNRTSDQKRGRYNLAVRIKDGNPSVYSNTVVFDVNDINGYNIRPFVTIKKGLSTNEFTVDLYTFFEGNTQYSSLMYENLFAMDYDGRILQIDTSGNTKVKIEPSGNLVQYAEYVANAYIKNPSDVGSSSVPVYVDQNGNIIACNPSDLMAGKDASGNVIVDTYATKSEVNNKTAIKYAEFSSKEDLNNAISPKGVTTYYRQAWETPSALNRPPSLNFYTIYIETKGIDTDKYIQTAMCPQVVGLYCVRHKTSNGWTPWTNVRYSPRNSNDVASFSSDDVQAYTGKAIAEYVNNAIGGNVGGYLGELTNAQVTAKRDWKPSDWFVASEKGTNVSYTTTSAHTISYEAGDEIYLQSNNELSVKPTTVYEKTNNKVTTVDDSNMHYPTTGAVKSFVENQISNLSVTYYNKTETDNAITEQIGTLDAEVTGGSTNVDVKVNQSNGKVTGVIITDRTQTKFDTVNSSIENLQSIITTGLAGKQDTLQWMTDSEVDTLWGEAQ